MVVAAVDERDSHRRAPESLREIQAGEAATDNHDMRSFGHSDPHRGAPPACKPDHVVDWWHGTLVAIRGVHAPPQVGPVGDREERRASPPVTTTERPRRAKQIDGEPRGHDRPRGQLPDKRGPRATI